METMKDIDFSKIQIEDIDGNTVDVDLRKTVGNVLFNMADDVAEHDLAVKIYHSDGMIKITDDEQRIIRKSLPYFKYIIQTALTNALEKTL
jgi:chaperonin cofactor prefoldin